MERGPALLEITVAGQAAPAGSKAADAVMITQADGSRVPKLDPETNKPIFRQRHSSETTRPWMDRVAMEASLAWGRKPLLDGPVWVEILALEPRPKGHYRSGQFSHLLRPDAPAYPHRTRTGDSDKLRRAIQDALTGVIYVDDKLVVDGSDRKDYYERACCIIHVGLMAEITALDRGLAKPLNPKGQETLLAA